MAKNKFLYPAIIGNILEYYDAALYGYLLPKLSPLFFPHENPFVSMLWGLGFFATGFLTRPLGGALFGHIGDRYGRQKVLILSIVLTGIPAFIVGLTPTYEHIGIFAPLILVLCRLTHGLFNGGESTAILVYVLEKTNSAKANFTGSIICSVSFIGALLGVSIGALSTMDIMPQWGWRIPFLISLFLAFYGHFFRRKLKESNAFKREKTPIPKVPLNEILRTNKRNFACTFGLGAACSVPYHIFTIYTSAMLTSTLGISVTQTLMINMGILLLLTTLLPFIGLWADKKGNIKLMCTSMAIISIFSYPLFRLIGSQSLFLIVTGQIILALAYSGFLASVSAFLISLFPVRTRSTGIGVAYNLGNCVFGGTTPFFAAQLVSLTGNPYSPALYLGLAGICGLVAVGFAKSTSSA